MRVQLEGVHSDEASVDSGVSQGTVLGPILFLCHINDLPDSVKSSVRLFAMIAFNTQGDHDILQQDLTDLESWAEKWGMRFNAKKCYILSMKNNNQVLEQVPSNPYLGLQIYQKT
jgi:hypothetical protein